MADFVVKTKLYTHRYLDGWEQQLESSLDSSQTLVLAFGSSNYFGRGDVFDDIKSCFSRSIVVGCSGGGVFSGDEILDDAMIVSVMKLDRTTLRCHEFMNQNHLTPEQMGAELVRKLEGKGLASIMILGDGLSNNGERILHGLNCEDCKDYCIWGGMAGDGSDFQQNWIYCNGKLAKRGLFGIAFYGDDIEIRNQYGSGWKDLGPKRMITTADGSRVFAIDNRSVLDFYSDYLGEYSKELPAIGARYPLMVEDDGQGGSGYLRSVLEVDRKTQSMRFAGNIPEGSRVQMKRGDLYSLVEGASEAALKASEGYSSVDQGIVITCNCVGRRVVLGQQAKLEIEAVRGNLPEAMPLVGFYSLGEITRSETSGKTEFFNETITLTTVVERNGATSQKTVQ